MTTEDGSSFVRVAEFKERDFDRLFELDRLCFPEHMQFNYLKLRDIVMNDSSLIFTAKDDQDLMVGYSILHLNKFEHEMLVVSLLVHPDFRQNGVGGLLLDFSAKFSRHMRVDRALAQVEAGNAAGLALLEKFGFRKSADLEDFFAPSNAGLEMELKIDLA